MKITYDEYDEIEEICEKLNEENMMNNIGTNRYFDIRKRFPTIQQMEKADVKNNFEEYFIYLMFWYTQKFDGEFADDEEKLGEYKASMKYIKELIDSNIEFADDEAL